MFSSIFYQQFHDNEIGFCRYSSGMRFYHQKGLVWVEAHLYCRSLSVYRLPFYVCKYSAILCWMSLWEAACHSNRSKVVGKMAKGWKNNNIVRRSCCVHHVSTGVTIHGHHTQHIDTPHVHTNTLTLLVTE